MTSPAAAPCLAGAGLSLFMGETMTHIKQHLEATKKNGQRAPADRGGRTQ